MDFCIDCVWEYAGYVPTDQEVKKLESLLYEIVCLEQEYFGTSMRPFRLENRPDCPKAPITYRKQHLMYVYCPESDPYRFAFQFTHELCHYLIPSDVPERLRWLEESIAVLASHYFSMMLKSTNQEALIEYIFRQFLCRTEVDFNDLKRPNSETLRILETSPDHPNFTDYNRYKSIALHILPAMTAKPLFWRAVPSLCSVEPAQDLAGSLGRWLDLVEPSDVHDALAEVISTFL